MAKDLLKAQEIFEQLFNCMVCLCPKTRMVYGTCQHRVCVDCLYDENDHRRKSFDCCPKCRRDSSFPIIKPDIPEENIEMQRKLGIRPCVYKNCSSEMWEWEREEHIRACPNKENLIIKTKKRHSLQPVSNRAKKINPTEKVSPRLTRSHTVRLEARPLVQRRVSLRRQSEIVN